MNAMLEASRCPSCRVYPGEAHLPGCAEYVRIMAAVAERERFPHIEFMSWVQANVVGDVVAERREQHGKWGDQSHHPDTTWLAILTEEIGECAQAVLHDQFGGDHADTLRAELVQVAAVALAWLEAIDRREGMA